MDPKTIAEDLIGTAKGLLRSQGTVPPGLFVISSNVTLIEINEKIIKEYQAASKYSELSDLMNQFMDGYTKALFLVFQNEDSIICLLFTHEKTYCRKISYIIDSEVTIADFGWEKDTKYCLRFPNPLKNNKLQD